MDRRSHLRKIILQTVDDYFNVTNLSLDVIENPFLRLDAKINVAGTRENFITFIRLR